MTPRRGSNAPTYYWQINKPRTPSDAGKGHNSGATPKKIGQPTAKIPRYEPRPKSPWTIGVYRMPEKDAAFMAEQRDMQLAKADSFLFAPGLELRQLAQETQYDMKVDAARFAIVRGLDPNDPNIPRMLMRLDMRSPDGKHRQSVYLTANHFGDPADIKVPDLDQRFYLQGDSDGEQYAVACRIDPKKEPQHIGAAVLSGQL